jgi:hypothetical protein
LAKQLDGGRNVCVASNHDHGNAKIFFTQQLLQLEPIDVWHLQVSHHTADIHQ